MTDFPVPLCYNKIDICREVCYILDTLWSGAG